MATCRKCNGTGRGPWRADGGKCWACTDRVNNFAQSEDDVAYLAELAAAREAAAARRAARRANRNP